MSGRLKVPQPAMVVALVALFVSIGGVGYAASKIDTDDIKNGAVTKEKIGKSAVTTGKIQRQAVKTEKLDFQSVTEDNLGSNSVTTGKLADQGVTNGKLAAGAVRSAQLGPTETVETRTTIPANSNGNLSAICPPGTTIITGTGRAASFGVHNVGELVLAQDNAWSAAFVNTTNAEQPVVVQVVCLSS